LASSPLVTAHRRVLRVAAGGERVGRVVVDHVDPRLGQPAGDAQALDQVVQPGVVLRRRGTSPTHRQRDPVRRPIGDERQGAGGHYGQTNGGGTEFHLVEDDRENRDCQDHENKDEQRGTALILTNLIEHRIHPASARKWALAQNWT
jgi:hypothetical protein